MAGSRINRVRTREKEITAFLRFDKSGREPSYGRMLRKAIARLKDQEVIRDS
jgi:hypothetical protein